MDTDAEPGFIRCILAAIKDGYTTFLSGMSWGVDLWAARRVQSHQIHYPNLQLVACLPCRDQAKGWDLQWAERHTQIRWTANKTICLQEAYTPGCMQRRNRYLVDHASRLIAVHDGATPGGTAQTIAYARKQGVEVVLIRPQDHPGE